MQEPVHEKHPMTITGEMILNNIHKYRSEHQKDISFYHTILDLFYDASLRGRSSLEIDVPCASILDDNFETFRERFKEDGFTFERIQIASGGIPNEKVHRFYRLTVTEESVLSIDDRLDVLLKKNVSLNARLDALLKQDVSAYKHELESEIL